MERRKKVLDRVYEIKQLLDSGLNQRDIAKLQGVSSSTIYALLNRHKTKARQLLAYHVKKGNIVKPSHCSLCGWEAKVQAHHHDYDKPLDVIWYCSSCHRTEHMSQYIE